MVKQTVTVNLDQEDLTFIEDMSRTTGIGVSSLIRSAVREWIRKTKAEAEKDENES